MVTVDLHRQKASEIGPPVVLGNEDITGNKMWVLGFDDQQGFGSDLLGGKGAGLAEMTTIGMPVPPGFTITTDACREYQKTGSLPPGLLRQVHSELRELEMSTGRRFGDPSNPLLVSVRSGASISMPGMMDTILNLGINQKITDGISESTGLPRFAFDTYRRFVEMFSKIAMGVESEVLDETEAEFRHKVAWRQVLRFH